MQFGLKNSGPTSGSEFSAWAECSVTPSAGERRLRNPAGKLPSRGCSQTP